ncbi:MAG TPA: DUF3500 domain-containing protein [Chitinophagaceae bacterium]|nr:DUF3500 domain-containing protein [Chitinophagaceae bacterium]
MKPIACLLLLSFCFGNSNAQNKTAPINMVKEATAFLNSLSPEQKAIAQFKFDDAERYHFNYIPMPRKGIVFKQLNSTQRELGMKLMQTVLSDAGFEKTRAIMELEIILKAVENRPEDGDRRDPEKYYFSIFGTPAANSIWGWRLEGHHISFNFTSDSKELVSVTPGFLGTNPAVVQSGDQKGKEILKDEAKLGFELLYSLNEAQKQKAIINTKAPADIVTDSSRKAIISDQKGILYSELNTAQQKKLVALIQLYINRYKASFAQKMWRNIEKASLKNLRFAWAGAQQPGIGNPHYYRVLGPTLIIEYDNTQNNANHAHTVVRDLKYDFGGDELLEHYKRGNHQH